MEYIEVSWSHHTNCYQGLSCKRERNIYLFCFIWGLQVFTNDPNSSYPSWLTCHRGHTLSWPKTLQLLQGGLLSSAPSEWWKGVSIASVTWTCKFPPPQGLVPAHITVLHTCVSVSWKLDKARQGWMDATESLNDSRGRCLPLLEAGLCYYRSKMGRRFQISGCLLENLLCVEPFFKTHSIYITFIIYGKLQYII